MNRGDVMDLSKALRECGALQFGEFTLASGAKSSYYIDIKKASTDPKVLRMIAQGMLDKIVSERIGYDRIAGVVLGSVPLATALALVSEVPFVMVRKEKKDHGTTKLIEGVLNEGDEVIVVEDVITSAGSSISAINTLRENGAKVSYIISVIDRESGGYEALERIGVKLIPLLKASEILKGSR